MRKIISVLVSFVLFVWVGVCAAQKDIEFQGKKIISQKPPFTITLPAEFNLVHSFSHENPGESSLTRIYFLVKTREKQVEEMLILQIADKTNPQASPMTAPPLKPYTEERMYQKGKRKMGELEINYLTQLMAWNPNAPSLQPLLKKALIIPAHWVLQGQFLFIYQGEHAVLFRYSKDVNAFRMKVSEKGEDWGRGSISGNERRVCETFQKMFMEMINSIQIKNP
jgi:hypothetical protein